MWLILVRGSFYFMYMNRLIWNYCLVSFIIVIFIGGIDIGEYL